MVFSGTYSQVIPACFAKDKFKAVLNSGFVLRNEIPELRNSCIQEHLPSLLI